MKKLSVKRILAAVGCLLLICLTGYAIVFFRHLPMYLSRKEPLAIAPAENGQIRMMSCNVRYMALSDLEIGRAHV